MGGNNILELNYRCQNATHSGSFIEMLEHRHYKKKKNVFCCEHSPANYFENEALDYIIVINDLKLGEVI